MRLAIRICSQVISTTGTLAVPFLHAGTKKPEHRLIFDFQILKKNYPSFVRKESLFGVCPIVSKSIESSRNSATV